ncbi:SRPBCC family protein [Rhodococcus sp. BP-252]|uniref:Cyclase n=1 Tax=Rhodococcoides kyotonense TaxID=398843 RepID=A0A177YP79_9NOCA|nr:MULTISPECIES: SRPBCC family protein [Rhodococcus]MBY6411382.1 SRPBCC family protein [Rhodococcus sp. BP-320]MBY6416041.1 SRPBCC family protein [Rhodococcus sp. BP-321]MBY6420450.1 SRPBCC family protein [Rhodococcus sp. BP-324]MBY6426248.1 SRPBCC family protein [Rhodococcus sp. BP-323]MBY6431211.1 SRPBCC family protein [Rhodococcus sp. BP-322]
MAEKTQRSITVDAPSAQVMDVIADFDAYPSWVSAAKSVEVLEVGASGRADRVRFVLDAGMVKDTYELQYVWSADGMAVSWELVQGEMQKSQSGSYTLKDNGAGGTDVTYELTVDLNIPMIGLFKRKAEKVITDTALKELKKRVEG